MRANLCLRTAERVLIQVGKFPALDFDELFDQVRALPWEAYFAREDRLVIERVRLKDSRLAAQTSVQAIVHKAIYERLGTVYKLSRLPETGALRSLRVYIDRDECLLGLDSSGEALHKRGYRRVPGEAPLKETLAAGILLLSGWNHRFPLLDPLCGSGTIAIEAGLFATERAPGLGRSFGFETMPFADQADLASERNEALGRVREDVDFRIEGSDIDPRAISAARANATHAGLGTALRFDVGAVEAARPRYEAGYLLCNPPYGERLGSPEEAEALYRELARSAARFSGWGLGFVTNRPDFGEFFGRYAPSIRRILNGAEEQWFHWYPAGSEQVAGSAPPAAARGSERPTRTDARRGPGRGGPPGRRGTLNRKE